MLAAAARQQRVSDPSEVCVVEIHLENHYAAKIYTSGSVIAGEAVIQANSTFAFDSFDIIFDGAASTILNIANQHNSSLWHFLLVKMPLRDGLLPETKKLAKGHTYIIPFYFIVPYRLPMGSCFHKNGWKSIQEYHTRPPPSMASFGAQIRYSIRARLTLSYQATHIYAGEPVVEARQVLHVLPWAPEDPPLSMCWDNNFKADATRQVRTSLFPLRGGVLRVVGYQPGGLVLCVDERRASASVMRATLSFLPSVKSSSPPKIKLISAKLEANTIVSVTGLNYVPGMQCDGQSKSSHAEKLRTSFRLFHLPAGNVAWARDEVEVECAHDLKGQSGSFASGVKYWAALDIPFTLPRGWKEFFVPTFHSCLVSRTYQLKITLFLGAAYSRVTLVLPLQICSTDAEPGKGNKGMFLNQTRADRDVSLPPKYEACPRLIIRYA